MACLDIVHTGEPNRKANTMATLLRKGLNEVFADKQVPWVAYGDFSGIKIHPEYHGPRPTGDDFIPYDNDYQKLDRKFDGKLGHAFRCGLLLNGVDWMGWGGSTSAAHSEEDIARTVEGFASCVDLLKQDGFIR